MKPGEPLAGTLKFDEEEPSRLYGNVGGCITPGYHKVETEGGQSLKVCLEYMDIEKG